MLYYVQCLSLELDSSQLYMDLPQKSKFSSAYARKVPQLSNEDCEIVATGILA